MVGAKSAKYPATLVGEALSGVVMAEAAKMKQVVWTKYIRPTLADFRGWSLFLSTPEGKNWFYDLWRRGQDPASTAWDSWRVPSWKNDILFPMGATQEGVNYLHKCIAERRLTPEAIARSGVDPEIVDMMLDMSTERFNQEIGASFTEYVGRVFKEFDEETHVRDIPYDPRWPLYAAVDYGWTNPFVWLLIQVDVWDNIYVIGEYRVTNRDINDIAEDLGRYEVNKYVKTMYPDPAAPGDTAVLTKKLRIKSAGNTGGELKWRLELIRQHLRAPKGTNPDEEQQPRLLIDRSCNGLIREMLDYRYPDTKDEEKTSLKEEPVKKDDHGPEALGRFMRGYFGGPGDVQGGRAKVSRARMG